MSRDVIIANPFWEVQFETKNSGLIDIIEKQIGQKITKTSDLFQKIKKVYQVECDVVVITQVVEDSDLFRFI